MSFHSNILFRFFLILHRIYIHVFIFMTFETDERSSYELEFLISADYPGFISFWQEEEYKFTIALFCFSRIFFYKSFFCSLSYRMILFSAKIFFSSFFFFYQAKILNKNIFNQKIIIPSLMVYILK